MNALVSVCNDLPEAMRAQPTTAADFVYGGNCPGLQLLKHFDGTAEADSAEAFLAQINPVKTMVINKLAKLECPNPKRWNESQKVLYPCREHSALTLRVKLGPPGMRTEQPVDIVCCFSTNCKRSYWKLRSSARNWMCYFDNTELSEQCRLKCMCNPQRCSSCDEAKCAGSDQFSHKPLLKQLEWLWERNKGQAAMQEMTQADRLAAIAVTERLLQRLKDGAAGAHTPGPAPFISDAVMPVAAVAVESGSGGGGGGRRPSPRGQADAGQARAGVCVAGAYGAQGGCARPDGRGGGADAAAHGGSYAPAPCFVMPTHAISHAPQHWCEMGAPSGIPACASQGGGGGGQCAAAALDPAVLGGGMDQHGGSETPTADADGGASNVGTSANAAQPQEAKGAAAEAGSRSKRPRQSNSS